MRIAVKDHFRAAQRLMRALEGAGHELVTEGPADLLLIDLDTPIYGYRDLIDAFKAGGAKVLLYPHGAGTMLGHDGLWEPYAPVDGSLAFAPGYVELARRMEYPAPTHVMGWSYCDLLPFQACRDVRKVLFAPTHPAGDGSMAESHRTINAETFAKLLEGGWDVTVRHIGSLEQNGLWKADGVEYVTGWLDLSFAEIDAADAVVAGDGTFPALAIARGVPTVMTAQGHPPMFGLHGEKPITLRRGERYLDYIRYPFDVADGPLDELLQVAAASEAPVTEWKARFIGEPFDDRAFATLIERVVAESRAASPIVIDDTRDFTVVALAEEVRERPELLAAYASAFSPEDDVTLILWGAGLEGEALMRLIEQAAQATGLDLDALPDVLLLPAAGSAAVDLRLGARASAVLSDWPAARRLGTLPHYGLADLPVLREAAAGRRALAA